MEKGEVPLQGPLVKHSVTIAGHRTSFTLEAPFWEAFCAIARERGCTISSLAAEVDRRRRGLNLSSALRVFVLESCRK